MVKNTKYINIDGLDFEKYRKMGIEKGWDELEKELFKRVKPGIKITDDVLDEIDIIQISVFDDMMEYVRWEEFDKELEEFRRKNGII